MRSKYILYYSILLLILQVNVVFAQKGKQEQTTALAEKAPGWVSHRPNGAFKYIGIGVADKSRSSEYQIEAKKNALYDLASEIKVEISTNSVLHSVSDNNSFDQSFNSLIKLTNTDNIEGYTLVDAYENDKQYWVYYELDKETYAQNKAKKKQLVIDKASNLISVSFSDEKNANFSAALKKRIQAFGILNPYLSEEINFDPAKTNGIKTVIELTNLIQNQLHSIQVQLPPSLPVVKPYQANYSPIVYNISINNGKPLNDFPFTLKSDDDYLKIEEKLSTTNKGQASLKINYVEPQFLNSFITLNPNIEALTANDSVSKSSLSILNQFIQTPSLKLQVSIEPVALYIHAQESNLGKKLPSNMIEQFVGQKFSSPEIKIVDSPDNADYLLEFQANTEKDISNDILMKNYKLYLSQLTINAALQNKMGETLFKSTINEIYGYANSLDNAGLNAYGSSKLKAKLSEALFFLKRKIIVY